MATTEDQAVPKRAKTTASERRKALRQQLWPEITEKQLWLRSRRTGFTTIPRTMPLIGQILDQHSGKGFPLASTYLTLWCWVHDEGLVDIRNAREVAHESGFSGPRAEATWRSRMKRLVDFGFIRAKTGLAGEYQYVLLLNPLIRIKEIYEESGREDVLYTALLGRMAQVGADDMDV